MCRHAGFRLLVRIAEEVRFPRDPIVLAFIWRSETRVSDPRGGILLLGSNQGKIPGGTHVPRPSPPPTHRALSSRPIARPLRCGIGILRREAFAQE